MMFQNAAELLALSGEPALLVRGGKIVFANEPALSLLGQDCRRKSFQEIFGQEIAGMQASAFAGEAEISGTFVTLRIQSLEGMRVVFLSRSVPTPELIGDAFLYALRSELMQLGVSVSLIRSQLRPDDRRALSALRSVDQSLYRVKRTMQNLSIIRGAGQGTPLYNPQSLDLPTMLRDLIESVRLVLPRPEIILTAPGNLSVYGDPQLLQALALNLLSNCFCHAEGCTRIRVTLHEAGNRVILSVADDGCGIPAERLHTALERYRFSGGLQETDHGPGLGLSASRVIARLHGGTLLLESREEIGTAVRVSLSRAPRALSALQAETPDYEQSYTALLTGLAPCLPPEAFDEPDR